MNFINIIIINNNNNNNKVRSAPRRGRTPEGVRDPVGTASLFILN